eukprot:CAMPEP_0116840200 /NCGR_PEP_ID=MMETSP0418-20121206/10200_1 /TAXON_ID=1158023 /ORGANISM="Astrosyne radiata, Strain 13vi08-1A" /LENGTH=88 /DNA_ID=CAMNT_0004470415 /DNA_START=555 /DNA_END=818 /DNA_ORIENTATION=-
MGGPVTLVGTTVGIPVGYSFEGGLVGEKDGTDEGRPEGIDVGELEGTADGPVDGVLGPSPPAERIVRQLIRLPHLQFQLLQQVQLKLL